jgi:hypothetical protein
MRYLVYLAVAIMVVVFWYGVVCLVQDVFADEVSLGAHVRWNCENMKTSDHPIPTAFYNLEGTWTVVLEDGSVLYGYAVDGGFYKWVWEDVHWMTNGIDVVYCEPDAKALSILLTK